MHDTQIVRRPRHHSFVAALGLLGLALALGASAPAEASHRWHRVRGYGQADFDGGSNIYFIDARERNGQLGGYWYAEVFIEFPGFIFDFEALYTVDCIEVDRSTGEAWIDGTIIKSNDPGNVGNRAFFYVRDGGRQGEDQHGITPLPDGVSCKDRPEPDFMETIELGDYRVR